MILHTQCLPTELAKAPSQTVIAATFKDCSGVALNPGDKLAKCSDIPVMQVLRAVKAGANTAIANATNVALTLDTVEDNTLTSGTFNPATSLFTATQNCVVSLSVQSHIVFASPTAITGSHARVAAVTIYKNGTQVVGYTHAVDETTSNSTVGLNPTITTNIALQTGDTVQVFIQAISAASGGLPVTSSITPAAVQATSWASRFTHLSLVAWKA